MQQTFRLAAVVVALVLTGLCAAAPVAAQGRATVERQARAALPSLVTEVDLERRMLSEDLAAYAAARVEERTAQLRAETLAQQMDTALAVETPDLANLDRLGDSLAAAHLVRQLAETRVDTLRTDIRNRLRRLRLIEGDLEVLARAAPVVNSPMTGVWQVLTEPGRRRGILDLDVDGTVITGLYEMDGFGEGSVRGSYAGLAIRLELLDAERGLDSVLTGLYDPDTRTLSGLWQPTELGLGRAGSGTWAARKSTSAEEGTLDSRIEGPDIVIGEEFP